jgi:hypothetical protein
MNTCRKCRRALSQPSARDALCVRCLHALDRGAAFGDDLETKPGKRPRMRQTDGIILDPAVR